MQQRRFSVEVQSGTAGEVMDTRPLRDVYGAFATGVTVVTVGGEIPHGMTANSFTTVSLDPPLVLVCVDRDAVMHERLLSTGRFGVSVLAADQGDAARYFADRRRPLGSDQFRFGTWVEGARTGAPLLDGATAHLECALWRTYDGGDHTIFVGRLLTGRRNDDDALLFLCGKFRRVARERAGVLP
jgi:flavin reductase (DIM6/NTAB) family NADH-FMN oxidoreductase RutF